MPRDVEFDVTSRDRTSPGLTSAEKKFSETQKKIDEGNKRNEKSFKSVGDAGKQASTRLRKELELSEAEVKKLALSFANAQSAAERLDISKALRKQQAEVRALTKNIGILEFEAEIKVDDENVQPKLNEAQRRYVEYQKRIDDINKEHQGKREKDFEERTAKLGRTLENVFGVAAPKAAAKLASAFTTLGEASGPIGVGVTAGLIGAAALAAPVIGATLSAAVVGGVAAGGIVGGVLLAVRDPRIQAAGKRLGRGLLSSLEADAAPFIGPVLKQIDKVEDRFLKMNGRIKNIFANSAGFLDPLVDGALNGIDAIVRGIDVLVSRAGPVVESLGRNFELVGIAIGDALELLSENGDDAASALDQVFAVLVGAVTATAEIIHLLTELYGIMRRIAIGAETVTQAFTSVRDATDGAVAGVVGQIDANNQLQFSQDATAKATADLQASEDALAGAFRSVIEVAQQLINNNRALFDSEGDVQAAFDQATESVKKNGKTLDANTEKGRANRDALSNVAKQAQANYDAFVKLNGTGPASAALADSLRAGFIKTAKSMGASEQQAQDYANKLLGIPSKRETQVVLQKQAAINAVNAVKTAISGLRGKDIHINVGVSYAQVGAAAAAIGRLLARGASDSTFGLAAATSDVRRTGGPSSFNINNNVQVSLDGKPFREVTAVVVDANNRRERWRNRVGAR